MARPIKNNADYFPHDADMRNDPKVKALRRKFGLEGYAIYNMVLEYLSDSDYFVCEVNNLGIELMSGDFDCDPQTLEKVIQYAISLDLLQMDNLELSCKSLENRLNPLLSKRERDRERVFANENTQSKVKESKVKESKEEESELLPHLGIDNSIKKLMEDEIWVGGIQKLLKGKNLEEAGRAAFLFLQSHPTRFKQSTLNDFKRVTLSWIENKKPEKKEVDQRERMKNL